MMSIGTYLPTFRRCVETPFSVTYS